MLLTRRDYDASLASNAVEANPPRLPRPYVARLGRSHALLVAPPRRPREQRLARRPARTAALPAQNQARHLPVHVRRPVAVRAVRQQAALGPARPPAHAGLDHERPADRAI